MNENDDNTAAVDYTRSLDLEQQHRIIVAIDPDGTEQLWLLDLNATADTFGCACATCAPHEQTGAMPARYRLEDA